MDIIFNNQENNNIQENNNNQENNNIQENNILRKNRNKFKQVCDKCNYTANKPFEWIKHIKTEKHNREGEKKESKCLICDNIFVSKWALNQHNLIHHSTKEERSKHKYYCNYCDVVFFMEKNYTKHNSGKIHDNMVKIYNYNIENNIPIAYIKK